MSVRAIAAVCLVLAALPASGAEWNDPLVAGWVAAAGSPESTVEARRAALDALREAARAQPGEERTREAILALALILEPEDEARRGESIGLMTSAAAYYPEDPRSAQALRRLALAQIASGDTFSAHFTLMRLFRRTDAPDDPPLLLGAADNALKIGETAAALDWTRRLDPRRLSPDLETTYWLLKLRTGGKLLDYSEAGEALEWLQQREPQAIRRDPAALLTAARTDAALGHLEPAAGRYESFVNVYTRHPERPAALLEQGRLLAALQRTAASLRAFDWLLRDHGESPEADLARLEQVRLDVNLSPVERAAAYRDLASLLRSDANAAEACSRILETLLAAGEPLEGLATLAWMAGQSGGMAGFRAREQLGIGLEPAMALLADRRDDVGLAAAAAVAESAGLPLSPAATALATPARERLGLSTTRAGAWEAALAAARAGRWSEVAAEETLEPARVRLVAESAWRGGGAEQALARIDAALAGEPPAAEARPLLVLRADIRFASGATAAACPDYLAAARVAPSAWVEHQLEICDASSTEGSSR